jgi:hypothetical protein
MDCSFPAKMLTWPKIATDKQLALPIVILQNQTFPLRSHTGTPGVSALYPSSSFNLGMAEFTDSKNRPTFREAKQRPFLAEASLAEFASGLVICLCLLSLRLSDVRYAP